ncbi:uncharacterized protein DSM5745_02729 [Aspergillus mulundensis]|uniref:Ricin B lectin domain-containing protein n=1 Tax=Aspergillus mulundensis TaxID=1810919 RepID=A0A3D8SIC8_9EURO|nr:hypothetical protein DSM5745_02729 [Aspergillus mulundensis]RDW86087.1 hypothetical protein DSM5745_02729 [Aspergillus mulundensis]
MRFTLAPVVVFMTMLMFAVMSSAHTVQCAGKAIAANYKDLKWLAQYLEKVSHGTAQQTPELPQPPKQRTLGPNSCERIACANHAEVRWCNEDPNNSRTMEVQHIAEGTYVLLNDCVTGYHGTLVAGGYLTHPDMWSVIAQSTSDSC